MLPVEEKAGLVEVLKAFIKEDNQIKSSENSKNEEPLEYLSNDSLSIIIPTSDEKPEQQKLEETEENFPVENKVVLSDDSTKHKVALTPASEVFSKEERLDVFSLPSTLT